MINHSYYSNSKQYRFVFIVGFFGNALLTLVKLSVGLLGYSKLVLMDGLFSMTIAVIFLLMWQGDIMERRESTERHPYGYGKALFIIMFVVGLVALVMSIYIFFYSLTSIGWFDTYLPYLGAVMATVISVIGNEILYRYLQDSGRHYVNSIISWNAMNNRFNVIISSIVLSFLILSGFGAVHLERIGVVFISITIFCMSLRVLFTALGGIMDKVAPKKIIKLISSYAGRAKEVENVLKVKARYIGTFLHIDLWIAVNEELNMKDADKIARGIEKRLIENVPFTKEANVILT